MATPGYARLEARLDNDVIVLDGATGTELEARGADMHERAWCAMATLTATDMLREIHEDYIRAGADVIITNTFSSNRNVLEPAGLGDQFEALIDTAVAAARDARERCGRDIAIAGSMSHQVPLLGKGIADPSTFPTPALARARFTEIAERLADGGVDFLMMEMMSNPDLANIAIEAARATGLPVWVGFSAVADENGQLRGSVRRDLALEAILDAIDLEGIAVAGIMHTNVPHCAEALRSLGERWSGPTMCFPDSGWFKMPNWNFEEVIPADEFARAALQWHAGGVSILGGCCGLGVAHIETLHRALRSRC